ncbi:hypothetical protein M7I_2090 [Glarea lozoyensis 74030]|uniref:Uncharacterized protein n=1 Tax=Glarea lozoyensis (strain ATCC 74030 / MF5533) TaxID=1104152 RepID=H0EHV1_GLAL7|nr:hypothetical protein M7I_2090 [Glarea lozoyensis 74030]
MSQQETVIDIETIAGTDTSQPPPVASDKSLENMLKEHPYFARVYGLAKKDPRDTKRFTREVFEETWGKWKPDPENSAASQKHNCAILRHDGLTWSTETFWHGLGQVDSSFLVGLEDQTTPSQMTLIIVALNHTRFDSVAHRWRAPAAPNGRLIEKIGAIFDIHPFFFDQMMSNEERSHWSQRPQGNSVIDLGYRMAAQVKQTCLLIGLDRYERSANPRFWITYALMPNRGKTCEAPYIYSSGSSH